VLGAKILVGSISSIDPSVCVCDDPLCLLALLCYSICAGSKWAELRGQCGAPVQVWKTTIWHLRLRFYALKPGITRPVSHDFAEDNVPKVNRVYHEYITSFWLELCS